MKISAVFLSLASLAVGSEAFAQPLLPSIEEIAKKWQSRTERATRLHVSWTARRTIPKGEFDLAVQMNGGDPKKGPFPPNDAIVDEESDFLLSGSRFRLDTSAFEWSVKENKLGRLSTTVTSDGTKETYYIRSTTNSSHGTATVRDPAKGEQSASLRAVALVPVLMCWRGADHSFCTRNLHDYEVTRMLTYNGLPCVELVRASRSRNIRDIVWLGTTIDFMPVQISTIEDGVTLVKIDVKHTLASSKPATMTGWQTTLQTKSKRLVESTSCTITRFDLTSEIEDSQFDVKLAPGTRLVKGTRSGESQSVIKADGQPGREVAVRDGERIPSYEELVEASNKPKVFVVAQYWPWLAAVFAATLMFFFVRQRIRRSSAIRNS